MAKKNKLVRDLEKYHDNVLDAVKDVIESTLQLLKRRLLVRMPGETGAMKESISVVIEPDELSGHLLIGAYYAIYVNYGTGIHAEGPGGSRAKKIPWVYFNDRWGRFVLTHGQKAQHFWGPSIEDASRHFVSEMRKLGR